MTTTRRQTSHRMARPALGPPLLLCIALSACSNTPPAREKSPTTLEDAIRRDLARAGEQEKHVLRHNPASCRCPAFELELGARWVRVALTDQDEPASLAFALRQRAERDTSAQKLTSYTVYGSVGSSISRCGQGAPYLTLSLEPPPEPP